MPRTIRADCPSCGQVEFSTNNLTLTLYPGVPERNYYVFRCPGCVADVATFCSEENVQKLLGSVRIDVVDLPAEALEERDAPPLAVDDLLDFINALSAI